MLSDYAKLDVGGIIVEANYNEAVKPSKIFRFIVDGKTAYMGRDDLYSLLVLFGDDEQKEQLIPVRKQRVKEITRLLKVRAKKNMKKGEVLVFPYTYFINEGTYEELQIAKEADISTIKNESKLFAHVNKKVV